MKSFSVTSVAPWFLNVMTVLTKKTAEAHRDYTGAKFGMWLFLFTEILLFGGMFLVYAVYRTMNSAEFHAAAKELSVVIGTANTAVLLTSSLTMALSIAALRQGERRASIVYLTVTISLGLLFLANKYVEWSSHIHHGLYPDSPELLARGHGQILFYGLYYVMTGLHGLHVLIGVGLLAVMLAFTVKNVVTRDDFVKLENSGLYWHLVDLVWIYLFPLFYLIT
jgi:cytochrome c oxidase subunit 3